MDDSKDIPEEMTGTGSPLQDGTEEKKDVGAVTVSRLVPSGARFPLGDGEISFTGPQLRYQQLFGPYRHLVRTIVERGDEMYKRALAEGDQGFLNRFAMPSIKKCAQFAVQTLDSWGCHIADEESLLRGLDLSGLFQEELDKIAAVARELDEKYAEQREKKKAWMGEQNSIWGKMMVGATAAVFEKAGNKLDDAIFRAHLTSPEIVNGMVDKLAGFVAAFPRAVCSDIERMAPEYRCEVPSREQDEAIRSLQTAYEKGRVSREDRGTACMALLAADPYHAPSYAWAFEEFGDEKGGLRAMANAFGVEGVECLPEESVWKAFGKSSDITTPEKLDAARKRVAEAKARAGLPKDWTFEPLERAERDLAFQGRVVAGQVFDSREEADAQRAVYETYVASRFPESAETCAAGMEAVREKAAEAGVDAGWLLEDMETAARRHAENARVRYGYLYDTQEEWASAAQSEDLFFKAVWAQIKRWTGTTAGAMLRGVLDEGTLENVRNAMGTGPENLFVLVNTGGLATGRTGLAITGDGMAVSNGSAMAAAVADNALVKKFLFAKAKDFLEKKRPKGASIGWAALLNDRHPVTAAGGTVTLAQGVDFEGSQDQAAAVAGLVNQLKEWAGELAVPIGNTAKAVPEASAVRAENPFTPWPKPREEREIDACRLVHLIRWRKNDIPPGTEVVLPADDAAPGSFTWRSVGGTQNPERPILCCVKKSASRSDECVALTEDALLIRNGISEMTVPLDAIVGLKQTGRGLKVTTRMTEGLATMGLNGGIRQMVFTCPVSGNGWLEKVLGDYFGTVDRPPSAPDKMSEAVQDGN